MFWKFDLNTTSHVDKLLDKEDVTLQELMDEDDILQECKAQNRKLLDFLCQQHCMEELVTLITHEPPLDMDEKVRFKYPNTACELLTSDVPQINDKLGGDETLLNILYDFLDHEPPLNPLLASFFSKTIGNLIARKTEQVIAFLRKKEKFISLVLKHIDTSAMMDLLLRLISCVEPATLRQEVLNWLNEAKIIQRLVELIHSSQDEDRQSNASQTLCDIIRLSRDQSNQLQDIPEPDPLLTALESQECVEQLLKNMFDGEQTENCIVNGTQVLLTLLETRRSGVEGLMDSYTQGFERSYTVNSSILHGIEPRLKDFHQLLLSPPKKTAILTTIGVLEEPLGNARLHGSRLIAALLHTNTPSINQELCRLSTMNLLLDLFFKYTWNNFLHFQVELSIAAILSHSVQEGKTTTNDLESKEEVLNGNVATENSETPETTAENIMVTHLFQKCCLVQRILDAWEANDKIQAEGGMRRGNMGHLTRIANAVVQNMEKGPMQTQISEFIKGMCSFHSNFVDQFGFNDEEFLSSSFQPNASLFEACCNEHRLLAGLSVFWLWGHFGMFLGCELTDSPSVVSPGAGWTAVFEPVSSKPPAPCVAMDVGSSVWDAAAPENAAPEEKGWAKFTDFQPFCCSESGPRCSSPVDTESNDSGGNTKQSQDKNFSTASPCVWNVCVTRKAPLVASDSSSSGGSDSEEEEEKADTVTETISTGSGQETIKLTVDAKNEKAVFTRCERNPLGPGLTCHLSPSDTLVPVSCLRMSHAPGVPVPPVPSAIVIFTAAASLPVLQFKLWKFITCP
uniref:Protein phosphatase 6 regulatory subunit 2 n=1 Tax=Calidris pygmaea TaxID=425635 RepID=A0A8C3KKE3_9CHAR